MAKIKVELEINENHLIGEAKSELKKELISMFRDDLNKKIKGREVVIEGLIASSVTQGMKNLLHTDSEIKKHIQKCISEIKVTDMVNHIFETKSKEIDLKIEKAIQEKINRLMNLTGK